MQMSKLNEMTVDQLRQEVLQKSTELFKIRLRCHAGVEKTTHLFKKMRRDIARIKTALNQKKVKQDVTAN